MTNQALVHPTWPKQPRVRSPWSQLSLFFGLAGATLIIFAIEQLIVYLAAGVTAKAGALQVDQLPLGTVKLLQMLFSLTVFGLTGYLYAVVSFREEPGHRLGLRPAQKNIYFLLAVCLLLLSFPLEEWLGAINRQIPLAHWMVRAQQENERQVETFLKVRHAYDPVVNLVIMAAIPAFCEELCFRGALQRILIQICRRPWAGILLAAFLFSFLHFEFEGFLPRFFLGILLGAAYWYSGSLWVPIVAHFFFNAVQIVVAMYNPAAVGKTETVSGFAWVIAVLFSIVIVVGLLVRMRRLSTVTYAGVYE